MGDWLASDLVQTMTMCRVQVNKMKSRRNTPLDGALPRLLDAYDHGRLVPFLGAGVSVPVCPLWREFVENLARLAGLPPQLRSGKTTKRVVGSPDLIRRAADAVRRLKNDGGTPFVDSVSHALQPQQVGQKDSAAPVEPPVSLALAHIRWPLVLTTNDDDWFYALWNREYRADTGNPALAKMEVVWPWKSGLPKQY